MQAGRNHFNEASAPRPRLKHRRNGPGPDAESRRANGPGPDAESHRANGPGPDAESHRANGPGPDAESGRATLDEHNSHGSAESEDQDIADLEIVLDDQDNIQLVPPVCVHV